MNRNAVLITVFLGFLLLVYYVYTTVGGGSSPVAQAQPQAPAPPPPVAAPAPKKKEKTVPADYPWAALSKQDLEDWAALFENQKKPAGYAVDMLVDSGKSIVAEVYEAKPGEYVFTKLTPTIGRDEAGMEVVFVDIDSFGVTVDGEFNTRVNHREIARQNSSYTVVQFDKGGSYMVHLAAKVEAKSKVRLTSSGGYQKAQLKQQNEAAQAQQK